MNEIFNLVKVVIKNISMQKIVYLLMVVIISSCTSAIKKESNNVIQEEGTEITTIEDEDIVDTIQKNVSDDMPKENLKFLGYWVGYFEPDISDDKLGKGIIASDGVYWSRENKITISIDNINGSAVIGHSIVAGNERPFEGIVSKTGNSIKIIAKEPGDDRYDGEFNFEFIDTALVGTWRAYKKIEINKRKYTLVKRVYNYNPDIMLIDDGPNYFIDFEKYKKEIEVYGDGDEIEEYERFSFSTSTYKIFELNASNTVLKKEDVENLTKGDLKIIRNTIYARHGYSFKNRPMRVFFDAEEWYIPISANIKADFSQIEKDNINLLLKYEKNAEEYYDTFGR